MILYGLKKLIFKYHPHDKCKICVPELKNNKKRARQKGKKETTNEL